MTESFTDDWPYGIFSISTLCRNGSTEWLMGNIILKATFLYYTAWNPYRLMYYDIFFGAGGAEYTLMSIHKLGGKYTPLPLYHVRWTRSAVLRKTIERSLIFIRLFYNSFNTMRIFSWYSTMTTRLHGHGQPYHISMGFWCRHYHQCSNLLLVWSVIVVVA